MLEKHTPLVISDLGSGINFNKKGLNKLLSLIFNKEIDEIIVIHKDRLLRFGFNLIEKLCYFNGIKITILNENKLKDDNTQLVEDVITLMTVFSAKLYGKRSHKNKKHLTTI